MPDQSAPRARTEHDRAHEARKMAQMERWLDALCAEIGGDRAIVGAHRDEILRLISTVAHGPSRPGAPMTAFVLGWAAATTGGDISELAARAEALAATWEPPADQ